MSGAGTGQVQGLRTVSSPVETKINKRKRDKMKRHKPSLRPDTKPAQIVCQTKCSILHCVSGEHRCSILISIYRQLGVAVTQWIIADIHPFTRRGSSVSRKYKLNVFVSVERTAVGSLAVKFTQNK